MMKRTLLMGLVGAAWLAVAGAEPAHAATAEGTILTNTASLSMNSGPYSWIQYECSYAATATVLIIPPPRLVLSKQVTADGTYRDQFIAGAGAVLTYRLCAKNDTVTVASGVVMTDRMPAGMAFDSAPSDWTGGNYYTGAAPTLTTASGAALPPATAGWPAAGTAGPLYLRWTVSAIDSFKSVCVTFRVTIQ